MLQQRVSRWPRAEFWTPAILKSLKQEGQQSRVKSSGKKKKKKKHEISPNKANKQNNPENSECCLCLCHPEELGKSYILRDRILSVHGAAFRSTHQTSSRFMPCHGKAAIPRALPSFCPSVSCYLSCSRLVPYLKALGATCSCFLLPPTSLQMFQSLTWIPTLSST